MRAVLLDLDGVLVDSWDAVTPAFLGAASQFGLDGRAHLADFRARMGMPLETIVAEFGFPSDFPQVFRAIARAHDPHVRPFEGIPAMLHRLRAMSLRIGVVTGKDRPRALGILETTRLAGLVDAVVTATDAPGKPKPDGLWLCENLLGSGPSLAFVGDTDVDLQAAENAQRLPILATWGGFPLPAPRPEMVSIARPEDVVALMRELQETRKPVGSTTR
ncbi:MAG: HAD family hydrolase [Hyphomicrobiales bacterium]|nr:HAD family hydrolase [Hyphomicrobiales bacterium]MBV8825979.1 HAD family hydrolase [Hyphomicrobiales bacterium]MBV9428534.1 HAD family hydrolase [Bradyrhizobiaceae bacterium]